ncbi:MAG: hypothetical protein AAGG56_11220 [Pseudomonadota bacterium]
MSLDVGGVFLRAFGFAVPCERRAVGRVRVMAPFGEDVRADEAGIGAMWGAPVFGLASLSGTVHRAADLVSTFLDDPLREAA